MKSSLQIASGLWLPLAYATKTAAILAQRRKGKTYLASVIAEEMVAAKLPFVAIDPTGAWWGLRSSADGLSPGLPVVILGGQHGDVPLERTAGKLVADLVVDEPGFYVLDYSAFDSGEAERQFSVDFAERLYRAKGQPGKSFPLHLFVDEADKFIPQVMRKGQNDMSPRLLGAFEAIVRRGGIRGLGTTLISQRAAVVNKNVLEMLDVLFVLRTIGPNDRKAVAGYLDAHGTTQEKADLLGSLASLELGEAWVWEPGADLFRRVRIRERRTLNSSATPEQDGARVEPRRLAKVDLEALNKRMADTIERAKRDDPAELRRLLAEKDREIARLKASPREIRGPALTDKDRAEIKALLAALMEANTRLHTNFQNVMDEVASGARLAVDRAIDEWRPIVAKEQTAFVSLLQREGFDGIVDVLGTAVQAPPAAAPARKDPLAGVVAAHASRSSPRALSAEVPLADGIPSGMRRMLVALAQRGAGLTQAQLGIRAGLSPRTGTFARYLARGRREGWFSGSGSPADPIVLSADGRTALGPYDPLPTGFALADYWYGQLPSGAARMLRAVVQAAPRRLTHEELGAATLLSPRTGTFARYLAQLRRLELIVGSKEIGAADELVFDVVVAS